MILDRRGREHVCPDERAVAANDRWLCVCLGGPFFTSMAAVQLHRSSLSLPELEEREPPAREDLERAASIIAAAVDELGLSLDGGSVFDLLADHSHWPTPYIRRVLSELAKVGAFALQKRAPDPEPEK